MPEQFHHQSAEMALSKYPDRCIVNVCNTLTSLASYLLLLHRALSVQVLFEVFVDDLLVHSPTTLLGNVVVVPKVMASTSWKD